MPANRIRRTPGVPDHTGSSTGFVVDSDSERLAFKDTDGIQRYVAGSKVEYHASDFTVTPEDDGALFEIGDDAGVTVTLPLADASTKGMKVTVALWAVAGSGAHAVSPNAADTIRGNGFTPAADKDAICTAATDRIGDSITLQSDGAHSWFITSVVGTWAREA